MDSADGKIIGTEWTYKIYFDQEADKPVRNYRLIGDEELNKEQLTKLFGKDEKIEKVFTYKHPLNKLQVTNKRVYHMFVVFKTHDWWWSIEKDSSGITFQRSSNMNAVRDKNKQKDRVSRIQKVKSARGSVSVFDLLSWLNKEKELNKKYNIISSNCQHFAEAVFKYVKEEPLQIQSTFIQVIGLNSSLVLIISITSFIVFGRWLAHR